MERRASTGEPARLYEAILHLRRLGHQVRRHPGPHEKGAARHLLDGAPVSDAVLLELAMTRFRRAARIMAR